MIKFYPLRRKRLSALTTEIEAVEQRALNRQQMLSVRRNRLINKIRQQLTAPNSLLLASSIGFIFAELTKSCRSANKSTAAETSPLTTTLNLVVSLRTLYMALPVAWIMKTFKQRNPIPATHLRRDRAQVGLKAGSPTIKAISPQAGLSKAIPGRQP
jgi:hypothetical protein